MSYLTQARMSEDVGLMRRIAACAAGEGVDEYATTWASRWLWQLAASPGWDAAYAYALASGVADPGVDESVITDGMILSAVQSLAGIVQPEPEPEPVEDPGVPEEPEPVEDPEPEPEPVEDPEPDLPEDPEPEPEEPEEPEPEPDPEDPEDPESPAE